MIFFSHSANTHRRMGKNKKLILTFLVTCVDRLGYMFRLTGGDAEQGEGRVEVYLNDEWSTICHYGWSEYFADAVCQHLGVQGVKGSNWNVPYGGGTGPVVCAEIFSLTVCPSDAGGVCTHAQDVGVRCETDEGEADGSEDEGRGKFDVAFSKIESRLAETSTP